MANKSSLSVEIVAWRSQMLLFVEFLAKGDRVGCWGRSRLAGKREWEFLICYRMF
ncbi:hypothetical protein [Microcoleus sp. OTE_8_concoct_300]|uniref:hypothetical protein n=1 Tax=Microcoleus sp. OTE_8_concoct_300 TaxID=2964710 RepID=UPI00403F15B1